MRAGSSGNFGQSVRLDDALIFRAIYRYSIDMKKHRKILTALLNLHTHSRLPILLMLLCLSATPTLSSDKFELKAYLGSNSNYTFGAMSGEESPYNEPDTPVGIWRAELRQMPESSLTGGIEATYFVRPYLGFGIGLQQIHLTAPNQTLNLTSNTGTSYDHYFPEFSLYGPAIHMGPTLRIQPKADRFSRLTYYAGLHATYFFGTMTGSDYDAESVNSASGSGTVEMFRDTGYGKSVRTYFNAFGYMPKLGVSYALNERVSVGAEWRLTHWTSVIAGGYRSFSDGFANDEPTSFQSMLISCTYRLGQD